MNQNAADYVPKRLHPKPPDPPPMREIRCGWFGDYETKESKQRTADWQSYIRGYSEGLAVGRYERGEP